MKCNLCGGDNASLFGLKDSDDSYSLCDGCSSDVKELFSLAISGDTVSYNKFKCEFIDDFKSSKIVDDIVRTAEYKRSSLVREQAQEKATVKPKTPKTKKSETVTLPEPESVNAFTPLKLFLSTCLAIISIFIPCFGICGAVISYNMAFEISPDFSPKDVYRARNLSNWSIKINAIEIILTIIVAIIIVFANL